MGSNDFADVRSEIEKVLDEPRLTEALAELTEAFDGLEASLTRLERKRRATLVPEQAVEV